MGFWSVSLLAIAFLAQNEPVARPVGRVIGEVTATGASSLTVKADGAGAAYTVQLNEKTLYLRVPPGEKDLRKAIRISLKDIDPGDRVLARGAVSEENKTVAAVSVMVMTKEDLAKKHELDREEWQRRGMAGTVKSISAGEITIGLHGRDVGKTVIVEAPPNVEIRKYAPDSVRFADARPSTLAELQVGDQLRVLGDKNADGSRIKAEEIVFGTFRAIAGQVLSVNAQSGQLTIRDLATKKPLTVNVSADTELRKMPEQLAAMLGRRLNMASAGGAPPEQAKGARPPMPQGAQRAFGQGQGRGPGGPAGAPMDLQQMLDRMPTFTLSELKQGDAVIVSGSAGADAGHVTAIALVAGVEPFLAAAPRSAGEVNLGMWNFDIGVP